MIKIEKIEVYGFKAALRGMRNPKNSWLRSDSQGTEYYIGPNDMKLAKTLCKAGPEHRKYLRMIEAYMDITAPLYWWKEFDTYKIGTVANSCSTMHKLKDTPIKLENFSTDHMDESALRFFSSYVMYLEVQRLDCNHTGKKEDWYTLIQMLPSSYNQKRTVMISYEAAVNMIRQRSGHKLDEWHDFVEVLKGLPNMKEFMS